MPTKIQNRREERRSRIPGFQDAEIELRAANGFEGRFPLVDLSIRGGQFRMPVRTPEVQAGTTVDGAILHVGELQIKANVQVLHVSRIEGNAYVCGVRLYPATEDDRNELAGLVSRLESLPQ